MSARPAENRKTVCKRHGRVQYEVCLEPADYPPLDQTVQPANGLASLRHFNAANSSSRTHGTQQPEAMKHGVLMMEDQLKGRERQKNGISQSEGPFGG